jgi:formate hydrogenlyase subunit 6/NADH:ubiquinone oxidoreductase subunit I
MVEYRINKEKCSACGLCADTCPVEAISQIGEYKINTDVCNGCGLCQDDCPSGAIDRLEGPSPVE